ncbi:MAG: carbon starvation protein A [Treponema sp. CETP13]|nr:MAG: carbon starvation protein A [Treponema sp. CETP13]
MGSVLIMVLAFVGYIIAYQLYGKFIGNKIFELSNANKTPSVEFEDGVDYVPTKKGIIFGHHFTSIAGTGPIVGPAIAVIWGWLPALIWVFVGSIVMGAVQDFSALVLSLRNQGKSISEVATEIVGKKIRIAFFLIVFIELWLFIAILGKVMAAVFAQYPESVFPFWIEIPIAIVLGWALYKKGVKTVTGTFWAVFAMYATVVIGHWIPINVGGIGIFDNIAVWTIILFIYAFIASTLPVTTLLQPRDYMNAWELFVAMGLLILGVIVAGFGGGMTISAPVVDATPAAAPSLWPFLFITIACGAISGFHSVVASGTTSKQIAKEEDALFVGYGSMLTEGALAVLVIIACCAGLGLAARDGDMNTTAVWAETYSKWGHVAPTTAFIDGSANIVTYLFIPKSIALIIMGVFVASFAGTSLDTTTRLQRYVIQELLGSSKRVGGDTAHWYTNKYGATAIALITAALLAFSGGLTADGKITAVGATVLWPLFGANNQTLAALALFAASVYLKKRGGKKYLATFLPALFMFVMTIWALVSNEMSYVTGGNVLLGVVNIVIIIIAVFIAIASLQAMAKARKETIA